MNTMENGFSSTQARSCTISQEVTIFNGFLCVLPEFSHAYVPLSVAMFSFKCYTKKIMRFHVLHSFLSREIVFEEDAFSFSPELPPSF